MSVVVVINEQRYISPSTEEREVRNRTAEVLEEIAKRIRAGEGERIDWQWVNHLSEPHHGPRGYRPRRQLGETLTIDIGYGPLGRSLT